MKIYLNIDGRSSSLDNYKNEIEKVRQDSNRAEIIKHLTKVYGNVVSSVRLSVDEDDFTDGWPPTICFEYCYLHPNDNGFLEEYVGDQCDVYLDINRVRAMRDFFNYFLSTYDK